VRFSDDFFGILGFCARARSCQFGSEAVRSGVRSGKVKLILADEGLSPRSMKDVKDMSNYYRTPLLVCGPEGRLGKAVGKGSHMVVGITDRGFADRLLTLSKDSVQGVEV